jgi:hypothetical protein
LYIGGKKVKEISISTRDTNVEIEGNFEYHESKNYMRMNGLTSKLKGSIGDVNLYDGVDVDL